MTITIRTRKLANGNESIFLDIVHDGLRQTEYLKMYLIPEKTVHDKVVNKITSELAEKIRAKRLLELQTRKFGLKTAAQGNKNFVDFFERLVIERYNSGTNYSTWKSVFKHLNKFTKGFLTFDELNERWMRDFKEYLEKNLSRNSAASYMNVLKHGIHKAIRAEIIHASTALFVESPEYEESEREFLTEEELNVLVDVPCKVPLIKRAFLFGCLTGLRISDIQTITWGQVRKSVDGSWEIFFKQKKTNGLQHHPVEEQAMSLVLPREKDEDRVFSGLKYNAHNNHILQEWILMAGIKKKIGWHCSRHTYACLLLNSGVEIFTVSKLLGHKNVATTQIYSKIIDKTKREAVNRLPKFKF